MRMRDPERSAAAEERLIDQVSQISRNLQRMADLDVLIERVGDARLVLIGEASHGTSEFYVWRALLSQRLIQEKDFSFVAVEGDWPDCYEINRFVKGLSRQPQQSQPGPAGFFSLADLDVGQLGSGCVCRMAAKQQPGPP
jgi:erythromycin esterase-like protein